MMAEIYFKISPKRARKEGTGEGWKKRVKK